MKRHDDGARVRDVRTGRGGELAHANVFERTCTEGRRPWYAWLKRRRGATSFLDEELVEFLPGRTERLERCRSAGTNEEIEEFGFEIVDGETRLDVAHELGTRPAKLVHGVRQEHAVEASVVEVEQAAEGVRETMVGAGLAGLERLRGEGGAVLCCFACRAVVGVAREAVNRGEQGGDRRESELARLARGEGAEGVRERVHEALHGEDFGHAERELEFVHDGVGSHARVTARLFAGVRRDPEQGRLLGAGVGRGDGDEVELVSQAQGFGETNRGAAAEGDERVGAARFEDALGFREHGFGDVAPRAGKHADLEACERGTDAIEEALARPGEQEDFAASETFENPRERPDSEGDRRRARDAAIPRDSANGWSDRSARASRGRGVPAAVAFTELGDARDELGVVLGEARFVEAHVVFEAGAAVSAELERPFVDGELVPADAGRGPGGARQHGADFSDEEFDELAARRQRILQAEARTGRARAPSRARASRARRRCRAWRVEDLDFGLHVVGEHAFRELVDRSGGFS